MSGLLTRGQPLVPNYNPGCQALFVEGERHAHTAAKFWPTLVDEVRPAGDNIARWDGTDRLNRTVASGTYFARLTGRGVSQVRPMALVR